MATYSGTRTGAKLDGFQDLLHPSRVSTLQAAAIDGPVVILNTSQSGSDAIILTVSCVEHVPLPDLTIPDVVVLVKLIQIATMSSGRNPSLSEDDCARIDGFIC